MRMNLFEREVPVRHPDPADEAFEQHLHHWRRLFAVRAFEIAVFNDRHGRMLRAKHVIDVARGHGKLKSSVVIHGLAAKPRSMSGGIPVAARLEEEPGAPLGFVDPHFDQAGGAVAMSRCSSHTLWASRKRAASALLSSRSSASMSSGSTYSASLSSTR